MSFAGKLNRIRLGLLGILGLMLVGWLAVDAVVRDDSPHAVLALTETLSAREGQIREQVLSLRYGLDADDGTLSRLERADQKDAERLASLAEYPALRKAIQGYVELVRQEARWAEVFRTKNALVHNSLTYFQYDVFDVMDKLPQTPAGLAIHHDISQLANLILKRNQTPHSDVEERLRSLAWLTRLDANQLPAKGQTEIDQIMHHTILIDRYLPELDSVMRQLLDSNARQQLATIARLAREKILAQTQQAERNRALLAVIASIMLIGLIAMGLRLVDSIRQIASQRRFLQGVTDNASVGVMVVDGEDRITFVNPQALSLLGYEAEDLAGVRMHEAVHVDADGRAIAPVGCDVVDLAREGKEYAGEQYFRRKDGTVVPVMVNSGTLGGEDAGKAVLMFQDITERLRSERELSLAERLFESGQQGVVITDERGDIIRVNPAFCRISGYAERELVGHNPRLLKSDLQDAAFYADMWREIKARGSWQGEIRNRRKSGEIYVEWLHVDAVHLPDGQTLYAGITSDITELHESREQLSRLAYYDTLTGLPNRTLFRDRLSQAIAQARREHRPLTLMFADLDNFKAINDTLGHATGDELLKEVATRLKGCVRESDTVARLGGDEFALLMPGIGAAEDVARIANSIIEAVSRPCRGLGYEVVSGASLGVTFYPQDAESPEQLLQNADVAMYRAKEQGKGVFQFYTQSMARGVLEAMRIETHLHRALEREEFILHYQPQFRLGGRAVGVEALLRWRSAELGEISPSRFIPIAEKCGLITTVGEWVLREACRQCKRWHEEVDPGLKVAVNLSAVQFRQPDLAARIAAVLEDTGLPGHALELEITESVVMEDLGRGQTVLEALKDLGCTLAIDDFGTGYSSLSYLRRLPVDVLKIDKSFIDGLGTEPNDSAVVRAIVSLARSLGLAIIAEGVESERQLTELFHLSQGDILAQGYLLGRPQPVSGLEPLLRRHVALATA